MSGTITGANDDSSMKVMVWEKNTMKPVCAPVKWESYSAYVFAYFRRPPGARDDERLCLGVSRDGYSFRALNGGEPVFQSSTEHTPGIQYNGAFRDPQIMRGEDGKFYVAVTDLLGTGNKNHQINHIRALCAVSVIVVGTPDNLRRPRAVCVLKARVTRIVNNNTLFKVN